MTHNLPSVVHVVPPEPLGGAQRVAIDLAKAQQARGLNAQLLSTRPSKAFAKAVEDAGLTCRFLPSGRFQRMRGLTTHLQSFEIAHLHLWAPWYPISLSRFPGKIVLHLHSGPSIKTHGLSMSGLLDSLGDRLIFRQSTRAQAISHWLAEEWRKTGITQDRPIDIVQNGIAIPPVAAKRTGASVIGVACRLAKLKGLEELMDALPALASRCPDVSVRIAGDGPLRAQLEQQAATLPIPVSFLGHVSDMETFWAGVDISIFTAPREPFGLRLIEPIARGIPVVAYYNGTGSDEVIRQCRGITGVTYGDSASMAAKVETILKTPATYERLATEGRADCIEMFSVEKMEEFVLNSYGNLTE